MAAADRQSLTDAYDRGTDLAAQAIHGLTRDQLLRVPPADAGPEVGKWSIQQVVIHLADAEVAFADRIKRIAAEDDPVLQAWRDSEADPVETYEAGSAGPEAAERLLGEGRTWRGL